MKRCKLKEVNITTQIPRSETQDKSRNPRSGVKYYMKIKLDIDKVGLHPILVYSSIFCTI
jgi:hypothetical protein